MNFMPNQQKQSVDLCKSKTLIWNIFPDALWYPDIELQNS